MAQNGMMPINDTGRPRLNDRFWREADLGLTGLNDRF